MRTWRAFFLCLLLAVGTMGSAAFAQEINLQPKYGLQPKNEAQKTADAAFLAGIDKQYQGNRKKAAEELSGRGWQLLRRNAAPEAMRRFNQAWLADATNGSALWGMAVVQAGSGKFQEALELFAEAERVLGGDIDFSADHARALGAAGLETKSESMLNDAFSRFARVYDKAPQHTLNLQNWAIALFEVGNYAEAWKKIKLAEATPRSAALDPEFLAALQSKMPRP
jgi:tetratricopeptide (TPR) repeat protein